MTVESPFDILKVYKPGKAEVRQTFADKFGLGLTCPVCGDIYKRDPNGGCVQQHVKWQGVIIRRRVCSKGHHYTTEEQVVSNEGYNEYHREYAKERRKKVAAKKAESKGTSKH